MNWLSNFITKFIGQYDVLGKSDGSFFLFLQSKEKLEKLISLFFVHYRVI